MALYFDGDSSTSHVVIPNESDYDLDEITVCLWYQKYGSWTDAYEEVISKSEDIWRIQRISSSYSRLKFSLVEVPAESTVDISDGAWHFIAGRAKTTGSTMELAFIQDGVEYTNEYEDGSVMPKNDEPVWIGGSSNRTNRKARAYMADVRIYNRPLTLAELEIIRHGRGRDNIFSGLLSRWPLRDFYAGQGSTSSGIVKDIGSLQNHGTPASATHVVGYPNPPRLAWKRPAA